MEHTTDIIAFSESPGQSTTLQLNSHAPGTFKHRRQLSGEKRHSAVTLDISASNVKLESCDVTTARLEAASTALSVTEQRLSALVRLQRGQRVSMDHIIATDSLILDNEV